MDTEMDLNETKESESQGTDKNHENSQAESESEEEEHDSITSSTTDESFPTFELLSENRYLGNKKKRVNKEIRRMSCDCTYSADEHDFAGCGDDCLNRLLMIECNNRCPCGEFCSNRKFQEGQKVKVEAFKTLQKGWGLRTSEDIPANQFVMEYCGEVMGYEEFEKRVETYDKQNRRHYYFMTLRADEIIDATHKGNLSRFINHSCSPNCETQKWTVNGYLRIGFFSVKDIEAGSELTFDYKFQRYGKKAQICYCESPNCRGIIGGEKHTPLKSIISGRAASPAPTSSPRRNRRRRLAEHFDDKPLEHEIDQLLGDEKGIRGDEQALKLSQFMVRAETSSQRLRLLDALKATEDQNCLRSFVRYQGLSLLWSWMVDLGDNSVRIQKKIVQVLKHLPVANLNQVKDTKVLKVISKWARKPSVPCLPEEETSSSDVDSRGLSPLELSDDASKREGVTSSSSAETDDDVQNASKTKDTDIKDNVTRTVKEDDTDSVTTEKCVAVTSDECKDNDSVFEENEMRNAIMKLTDAQNRSPYSRGIGDSSEEESRWSEDDCASTDSEDITDLAAGLLDSWRHLKEVYRIPKKSTVVEKREPESTSSTVEVVPEPSHVRDVPKIPAIPAIDGDLFQKDEFLSKLGEPESVERMPEQQEPTVNQIPALMSSTLTPPRLGEVAHEPGKLPIHQRLQIVASGGNVSKQYPIWHGKGNRKSRKHPYHGSAGAFQSGSEKWGPRHQVSGTSRFNQPTGHPTNQPMHPGVSAPPRQNVVTSQWQPHGPSPFPGGYQYPPVAGPRSSAPTGYPAQNPNQAATQPSPIQPPFFQPSGGQQTGDHNPFRPAYPTHAPHNMRPNVHEQASYGPGPSQMPAQTGAPPNMPSFKEIQPQSVNQTIYSLPPFDPSKPPPNFVPSQSNIAHQQFANTAQSHFPNSSSQFPNAPPVYPPPVKVPDIPSYPLQPSQTQQTTGVPQEASLAMGSHIANMVSTTSMVSSTVRETETLSETDLGSKAESWSAETSNKPRDVPLPPDWKKAYDAEGRAYYYHVGTRQTQWEPPTADRSPPTPELGYLGDELDSRMEIESTFHPQITRDPTMEVTQKKKPKTPSTPPGSPPKSPVGKFTTAAADTTDVRKGLYSPSLLLQGRHLTPEQRKQREAFRMKLSAVVVNYLNPYHKVDCKVGRITTVDDFKFLARKLTHGVMVKELSRLKDEKGLACNDSVKIKTKEYIRQYMQKFGPVYKPS